MKKLDKLTDAQNWLINDLLNKAKEIFKEDQYLEPVCFLMNSESNVVRVIPIKTDDVDAKETSMMVCKMVAKKTNADVSIILMETWYLSDIKKEDAGKGLIPSEHKDRKEGISIMIETRDGNYMGISPILRSDKSATFNTNITFIDFDSIEGRFTGIIC